MMPMLETALARSRERGEIEKSLTVHIKVIIRHILAERDCGATVVTEMKDSRLHTKPACAIRLRTCRGHRTQYIGVGRLKSTYHRR